MSRPQIEGVPERLAIIRKAARIWSDMDLAAHDSQDYADLYTILKHLYLKYDP